MDFLKELGPFKEGLMTHLPGAVDGILKEAEGKDGCLIGFLTTDDFYGGYLAWDTTGSIDEYYEWDEYEPETDFLYQPLVDIVDSCKDVDLCNASPEKLAFARALIQVIGEAVRALPEKVFSQNGFRREEVLFFATMSDGDYVEEMMNESLHCFNSEETLDIYDF